MKISRRLRGVAAGIAFAGVAASGVGACAPAPAPSANVLLHVNSTCEAMASKTGSTWSVRMTRSGSRCGVRMGAAPYRYGLPVGSILSRLDRDFDLHGYATGECTRVARNLTTGKYYAADFACRA